MEVSKLLFSRRAELSITQEMAAAMCCVTTLAYHRWENGKAKPQASNYGAIARFLGYDQPSELLAAIEQVGILQNNG